MKILKNKTKLSIISVYALLSTINCNDIPLEASSTNILSLDDEASKYFNGICDQLGLTNPCYKTIDLIGNIQYNRRLNFDPIN